MFLVAFIVPSVFFGLEVFVGFIQAFVFAMLTLVFASAAVAGHDDHDDHAEHDDAPDAVASGVSSGGQASEPSQAH